MNEMRPIDYPDLPDSASATDCTGLMYKPPDDMDEYESYQDVYGMEIPKQERWGDEPRVQRGRWEMEPPKSDKG